MAFEIYTPKASQGRIEAGQARFNATGQINLHAQDLERARITKKEVVVLVDRATHRIAIRAPRENDGGLREPTMALRQNKTGRGVQFSGVGIMRQFGVDARKLKGDWPIMHKDGLLIINLNSDSSPRERAPQRKPKTTGKERAVEDTEDTETNGISVPASLGPGMVGPATGAGKS
jgi:hypothetical protein